MWEFIRNQFARFTSDAYELPAVVVELLLIGLAINWCASVLYGTRGMRLLRGLLIVLVAVTLIVRVLSVQYSWTRLDLLYRYFIFGLGLIALVAFQPELRRAFMRAGDVRFLRRGTPQSKTIAAVVESAGYLSRKKYGALIAIQRDVGLRTWTENGTPVNADVSANLLNTIFFPNSPLHDLGVVIQDARILAANCQFPQAESDELDTALGSRHRAAVGLSNESDALVVVVSEETGTISLADAGELRRFLSLDDLHDELTTRLGRAGQPAGRSPRAWRRWGASEWWRVSRRLLIVAPLTLVVWYLADQASQVQVENVELEIVVTHGPEWDVRILQPTSGVFRGTFTGSTRAIEQLKRDAADRPVRVEWPLPRSYEAPGRQSNPAAEIVQRAREVHSRGVRVDSLVPETLIFDVEQVIAFAVPVRAESGKVRIADAEFTPREVQIAIRRRELERLTPEQRFVTARVQERLDDVPRDQTVSLDGVRIDGAIAGLPLLRVEPAEVSVSLRVIGERAKRRFDGITIGVMAGPQVLERYEIIRADPIEWLLDLELSGERSLIDALRKEEIRAYVSVSSQLAVPEPRPVDVTLVLPPGVTLEGPPRTVRLRLKERVAGSP